MTKQEKEFKIEKLKRRIEQTSLSNDEHKAEKISIMEKQLIKLMN